MYRYMMYVCPSAVHRPPEYIRQVVTPVSLCSTFAIDRLGPYDRLDAPRPRLRSFKLKKRAKKNKLKCQKSKPRKGFMDTRGRRRCHPPPRRGRPDAYPPRLLTPPWESPVARWGSKVPRGAKSRRAEGRERLSWLSSGVVGSSPPPLERGRTCARATYGRVCEAGEAERQPPWGRAKGPYTTR